jgi:hypothetical protein
MLMVYELYHVPSANLIGEYQSIEAALTEIHRYLIDDGAAFVADLALSAVDDNGLCSPVAEGDQLAGMARRTPLSAA